MLPRVSVVIPYRDASQWLTDSLQSVRNQQGVELELVLVDDGSTDNSTAIALRCLQQSGWPVQLLNGSGRGVSAARNLGWRSAQNPLIAFLDADDLMLPGRLAQQAELFDSDSGLGHNLCGWRRINEQGKPIVDVQPWLEGAGFELDEALRHKAVLPSAWMLRRDVLEQLGGFDCSLSQAEDVDLLLRLARSGVQGRWLKSVLCGYRVHTEAASRKTRAQARGLSFVVERHLASLINDPEQGRLIGEVRYGTRAWLGWHAWQLGDLPLAEQLWVSALGLSPMPPGLTWVHLAENVLRSAQRIGEPARVDELLQSSLWHKLSAHWWALGRTSRPLSHLCSGDPWITAYCGQANGSLLLWRQELRTAISQSPTVDWSPTALRQWCLADPSLLELRRDVLAWVERLLGTADHPSDAELTHLRRGLSRILHRWVELVWNEDRRPALQRLEQALSIWPTAAGLRALARLQQRASAAGADALRALARHAHQQGSRDRHEDLNLPIQPAHWEHQDHSSDQCRGPQCGPCIQQLLQHWTQQHLDHGVIAWHPPAASGDGQHQAAGSRTVDRIPGGQAWLRPPKQNAWGSTHAITVADAQGVPLKTFSSRYPQAWGDVCPHPPSEPDPQPPGEPKRLDGTVVVLTTLSGETYYHWLLEALPGLASLLEFDPAIMTEKTRFWHNGGSAGYVSKTLANACGIRASQLLDAREMVSIQASELVVISPPQFGWPSATAQEWLRQRFLRPFSGAITTNQPQRPRAWRPLWLWRGQGGRRPVFGELEVLSKLTDLGIEVLDGSRSSVEEQASNIALASFVIAPHGGAMANLVFAAPGTHILELHHPHYAPPYYHSLIEPRQLHWHSQAQTITPPEIYRDLLFESPATEPIFLDIDRVESAVRSIYTTYYA